MTAGKQINILLLTIITTVICLSTVHAELDSSGLTACEQEEMMRQIFYPKDGYELHANSLRNKLKQMVESYLISRGPQYTDDDNQQLYDNIDIDTLATSILNNKRNVANMARLASMRLQNEATPKRSIATLAKNDQLPSREPSPNDQMENQWNNYKRNIGSIVRTGILTGKRNIGALARDYVLPPHNGGKRNLPSILRSGGGSSTSSTHGPQNPPKRNVASLARDNLYPYYYSNKNEKRDIMASYDKESMEEKRNIGAVKNTQRNGRKKRDTINYDDFPDDSELVDTQEIYENTPYNYNDLSFVTNELYPNYGISDISNEKRFLGSVVQDRWSSSPYWPSSQKRNIGSLARQGLLRSDMNSYLNQKQYRQQSEKRHLGALARNGWMPAFRSARGIGRFSRSGRARSRTGGFYPQQERLLQPIAGVCERCRQQQHTNSISWAAPGLNHWGTPPRLTTAMQQRSFRGPFHPNDDIF